MSRPSTCPQPQPGALALIALCFMALLIPISANAAERVGRVLIVSGEVTAEREGTAVRNLARNDPIYAEDTIGTGSAGRIQIQFSDGGMVDLQPDSRFRIAKYELDDDGGGNVVMEFLRGALRTVTGSIGDAAADDEYRMDTPVATIGIRGTAYALHYCDTACTEAGGELGLYGRVDNGGITVSSGSGAIAFEAGQYFFAPEGRAPRAIVVPPEGILDRNGEHSDDGGNGDKTALPPGETSPLEGLPDVNITNEDDSPFEPTFEASETANLRPGDPANLVFGGAFVTEADTFGTSLHNPGEGDVRLLDDDSVVGAEFSGSGFINASEGKLVEQDSTTSGSPAFTVEWGRWAGPLHTENDGNSSSGGFAYAYTSASPTGESTLSAKSSLNYSTVTGPQALGTNGNLWDLTSLSAGMDFPGGAATLNDFTISRADNAITLDLSLTSFSGTLDTASSGVIFDSFLLDDGVGANWEGSMEGRFVGDDGDIIIMKYELDADSGNNAIRGIAILEPGV